MRVSFNWLLRAARITNLAFLAVLGVLCSTHGCQVEEPPILPLPEPPEITSGHELLSTMAADEISQLRQTASPSAARIVSDDRLTRVALEHANFMAQSGRLTHDRPPGTSMRQQLDAAGYPAVAWGENVAVTTAPNSTQWREVLAMWKDSPGHYRNMVNSQYQELGIAFAANGKNGRTYWCLVLGRRRVAAQELPTPLHDVDSTDEPSEQ